MEERREYNRMIEDKFDMIERLFIEKLDRLHDLQEQTLAQATKTNGRVNKLEGETELVRFVSKNKWVLWIVFIAAYSFTIKEFRDLLFSVVVH